MTNRSGAGLLDLGAPVAVLMIDVLHHIPDTDNPIRFIQTYVDAVCPDSYSMWLSHTPAMVALSSVAWRCFTTFTIYRSHR
jgi:hypothetical protein